MRFGSQTVSFVTITNGALDRLGNPAKIRTEVPVNRCRFRPLHARETAELDTNIATEVWKCTAPPAAAAVIAASTGELKHNGVTYKIIGGAKRFEDFAEPFKVTIICQKQAG